MNWSPLWRLDYIQVKKNINEIFQYFDQADNENEDEVSIISSKEIPKNHFREEFLGWLDKSGNGFGQLIRWQLKKINDVKPNINLSFKC
jgi:hypothetical protein